MIDEPKSVEPLDALYARRESIPNGDSHGAGWAAHAAVLDRLAANQRIAESRGWVSCAIERVDGEGRFRAWGIPPGQTQRHPIPDWSSEPG